MHDRPIGRSIERGYALPGPRHRVAEGIPLAVVARPARAGVLVLQCRVRGRNLAIVPVVEVALLRQFCG